jgi:transcription elongation factor GreA
MAREVTRLTPEGRETLESELETLVSFRRRDVANRITSASEAGGTVDNAEYAEAISERAFVEGRISDLEQILSRSIVTETVKKKKKGSRHRIRFLRDSIPRQGRQATVQGRWQCRSSADGGEDF